MIKKHVANSITLCNLLCGVIAIWLATHGQIKPACIFVVASAIFDFLDGYVARALSVSSELGKQLDSLSDIVSFGVAPAIIISSLLQVSLLEQFSLPSHYLFVAISICFINPLFAAYRLAKFNIDPKQSETFIGLPSPANGLFFISLAWWIASSQDLYLWFSEYFMVYYLLIFLFSFLMVSPLSMFSLKFKNYTWQENEQKWILILITTISLLVGQIKGISICVVSYIILSLFTKRVVYYK